MHARMHFPAQLLLKAQGLSVLILDVDGVMTDGGLYFSGQGESLKRFHVQDGYGLRMAQRSGIEPVVISGRDSHPLRTRLRALGITQVFLDKTDKLAAAQSALGALGKQWADCAVIGDDWPDLPLLRRCGFAVAPANAHQEVLAAADHVTAHCGGNGAVRELCDLLLVAKGCYGQLLQDAAA